MHSKHKMNFQTKLSIHSFFKRTFIFLDIWFSIHHPQTLLLCFSEISSLTSSILSLLFIILGMCIWSHGRRIACPIQQTDLNCYPSRRYAFFFSWNFLRQKSAQQRAESASAAHLHIFHHNTNITPPNAFSNSTRYSQHFAKLEHYQA